MLIPHLHSNAGQRLRRNRVRRRGTVEHLDKASTNTGFQFGAISRDLDLSIGIPRIPQSARSVKGQALRRQPFDLERFPKRLGAGWRRIGGARFLVAFVAPGFFAVDHDGGLLVGGIGFPENGASGGVIDDAALGCEFRSCCGYGAGEFGIFGDCFDARRPFEVRGRVVADGRGHSSVTEVLAGFVGGKD